MKLISLRIIENRHSLFDDSKDTTVVFTDRVLISSLDNSKGKTSLIRFILYALGFKIPSTKGFSMTQYRTIIEVDNNGKLIIERNQNNLSINYADGTKIQLNISNDIDREKAIATIFCISNAQVIKNLLGIFYLDQDKGWTLLNRGKTIGENTFYIEKYILGLKDLDEEPITSEIEAMEKEIKRYSAIQDVYKLELDTNKQKPISEQQDLFSSLVTDKNILQYDIDNINKQINELHAVYEENNTLGRIIDSYQLIVEFEGKEFTLSQDKIKNFNPNQNIILAQIRMLKIQKFELMKKLNSVNLLINNNSLLYQINDLADDLVQKVKSIPISETRLSVLLDNRKKKLRDLCKQERKIIRDKASEVTKKLTDAFDKYAKELGVFEKIQDEKDYIFTRNLKEYSGAILHKLSFAFKLAYIEIFSKTLNIELPIIIDSPGSGEVTVENAIKMIQIAKKYLQKHQLIIASVYGDLSPEFDKTIIIKDKLMNKKNY